MIGDDRGQSIQIGAVLLFGILIIGLAFAQTVIVPAENESVEFNGYIETTEDLVNLRNDLVAVGTEGGTRAQSVQTGVRYPSRTVLINPGPTSGSLRTTSPQNVTLSGVKAVSGEEDNVQGFWNTSIRGPQNYTTQRVRFTPAYNHIDVPPVDVSPNGAYRLTDNGPLSLTGRSLVTGNRISLVTTEGDLSTSSLRTSVAATPVSVATRSVAITGTGSTFNVTVSVPGNDTPAAAAAWNDSAAASSLRANANVEETYVNGSRVDVVFNGSRTYQLKLARVVVHDKGDSGATTDAEPEPAYLVPIDGNGTEVPTDGSASIAVEVRDRYNNPVEGAAVEFSVDPANGTLDSGPVVTTGSDGRADVEVDIDDDVSTATLSASIVDGGVSPYDEVNIQLARAGADLADDGTGTDNINPSKDGDIKYVQANEVEKTSVNVTFNNTLSETVNITSIRFSFYYPASEGSVVADSATIGGKTSPIPGVIDEIPNQPQISPGEDTVRFDFDFTDTNPGGGGGGVQTRGDFFIITVEFDKLDGRKTYFIAVRK